MAPIGTIRQERVKEVIGEIRKIARQYKELELKTRQFVSGIHEAAAKNLKATDFVLKKSLPPTDALRLIRIDIEPLKAEAETIQFMHIDIFNQLDVQAGRASEAKKRNDARIGKSEGLKEATIVTGGLSVPLVGFGVCTYAAVDAFTEDIESTPARIAGSTVGVCFGAAVGAIVTIISPVLFAISVVLASVSYKYSKSFEDIGETIKEVQNVIEKAQHCIGKISTALKSLERDMLKCENSIDNEQVIRYVFASIKESSVQLICI